MILKELRSSTPPIHITASVGRQLTALFVFVWKAKPNMGRPESELELREHRGSVTSYSNKSDSYDWSPAPSPQVFPDQVRSTSSIQHGFDRMADVKGQNICEALDMYGDIDAADEYGYVERG